MKQKVQTKREKAKFAWGIQVFLTRLLTRGPWENREGGNVINPLPTITNVRKYLLLISSHFTTSLSLREPTDRKYNKGRRLIEEGSACYNYFNRRNMYKR